MSMPVMNQALVTYFNKTTKKPTLFAFGNMMGGTDASLFNSPYVENYLLENTNQLFAGQAVVYEYLPLLCRLSNLTADIPDKSKGLVLNEFLGKAREKLMQILPEGFWSAMTVEDVLQKNIFGKLNEKETHGKRNIESKEVYNFKKVAIANRGEVAIESLKALKKMRKAGVLLCSTADLNSYATAYARENGFEVLCLGGDQASESYLDIDNMLAAMRLNGIDSVMVGYGFLSENKGFAEKCLNTNIIPVMSPPEVLDKFGDKAKARAEAEKAGVPVVSGSPQYDIFAEEVAIMGNEIGYPLIVKAILGGGGKGMRIVERPEDLQRLCEEASNEAAGSFGDRSFYLEQYLPSVRHVEVQVIRDNHGNSKILDLRDCSLQRKHQKIIEETAVLSEEIRSKISIYSKNLLESSDYTGIGTVEFLYNPKTQGVYFMEVNPRIQVERKVSELRLNNANLIENQIRIAQGERINVDAITEKKNIKHTMQLRINAVNPKADFNASPGVIAKLDISAIQDKSGISVLRSVDEGGVVTSFYDSNIMLLLAEGQSREEVIKKLLETLDNLVLEGIYTNIEFLKACLKNKAFKLNQHDTHFIDKQGAGFIENLPEQEVISVSEKTIELEAGQVELKAEMPGVFHRSALGDEAKLFVSEGDIVKPGDVLAYTDAMKMQTSIVWNGDCSAKVIDIPVAPGKSIEAGATLFILEPIQEKKEDIVIFGRKDESNPNYRKHLESKAVILGT